MTKVKMKSKEEILAGIPWIIEDDRENVSLYAIAVALLDIRDILDERLDDLAKRLYKTIG